MQSLSLQRKKPFELSNLLLKSERFYNRDFLPRICMHTSNQKYFNSFNLNFFFNDYHQTGESSLLETTKYKMNIYSFEYDEPSNVYSFFSDQLLKINPKLVADEPTLLKPTETLQITNLVQSKYILEVLIETLFLYLKLM